MEVSCHFHFHFMQRAAVHILVYATCCSKIKRDAGSSQTVSGDPGTDCGAQEAYESATAGSDGSSGS